MKYDFTIFIFNFKNTSSFFVLKPGESSFRCGLLSPKLVRRTRGRMKVLWNKNIGNCDVMRCTSSLHLVHAPTWRALAAAANLELFMYEDRSVLAFAKDTRSQSVKLKVIDDIKSVVSFVFCCHNFISCTISCVAHGGGLWWTTWWPEALKHSWLRVARTTSAAWAAWTFI